MPVKWTTKHAGPERAVPLPSWGLKTGAVVWCSWSHKWWYGSAGLYYPPIKHHFLNGGVTNTDGAFWVRLKMPKKKGEGTPQVITVFPSSGRLLLGLLKHETNLSTHSSVETDSFQIFFTEDLSPSDRLSHYFKGKYLTLLHWAPMGHWRNPPGPHTCESEKLLCTSMNIFACYHHHLP